MQEETTDLPIVDAYVELRRILIERKCQIVRASPPNSIVVQQGSWLGFSPTTMSKFINFQLTTSGEVTKVRSVTYWSNILTGSLAMGYTACFFILGFASLILLNSEIIPFPGSPSGQLILSLSGIIFLLILMHLYSYVRRATITKKILTLLRVRGSPLHVKLTRVRHRAQGASESKA
ncbi:MAG: hypothetical protein ACFFDP_10715 [Promethearchaeota archaeon]